MVLASDRTAATSLDVQDAGTWRLVVPVGYVVSPGPTPPRPSAALPLVTPSVWPVSRFPSGVTPGAWVPLIGCPVVAPVESGATPGDWVPMDARPVVLV